MTANIAIEILRRINNTFLEDFPDRDTHDKIVDPLLGVDHQQLNDIRKDSQGWYVLEDFKLSPQTFVCEETLRVYFTNFLNEERPSSDIVHTPDTKTAESEQSHMKRCLWLFYNLACC
jgi:hypothetical protein